MFVLGSYLVIKTLYRHRWSLVTLFTTKLNEESSMMNHMHSKEKCCVLDRMLARLLGRSEGEEGEKGGG